MKGGWLEWIETLFFRAVIVRCESLEHASDRLGSGAQEVSTTFVVVIDVRADGGGGSLNPFGSRTTVELKQLWRSRYYHQTTPVVISDAIVHVD